MVYYLTLYPCACIGIVGTLQTTRRSASAKEQLHHPRGKHGREGGRRPRTSGTTARSKRYYRLQEVLPLQNERYYRALQRYYRSPTTAPLPLNPASSSVRTIRVRYYRSPKRYYCCKQYYRPEAGTTALPARRE